MCPYCGSKRSTKKNSFHTALTDEEVGTLSRPPTPTTFDVLYRIPLAQSLTWGIFGGIPSGLLAYALIPQTPLPYLITGFIFTGSGIAWGMLSGSFNRLWEASIMPVELLTPVNIPTVHLEVVKENGNIKRGDITSATLEQVAKWTNTILADINLFGPSKADLTQKRFTSGMHKVFSQPAYKDFCTELETLNLLKRTNPDAKNSPFKLTREGIIFVRQFNLTEL